MSSPQEYIRVIHPRRLPALIPCERIPLMPGVRMGYKPNVVQLSTGELVLANFHTHYEVDVDRDVMVIDEKTPDNFDSGGGFGNTLRLQDGSLLTPYSYFETVRRSEIDDEICWCGKTAMGRDTFGDRKPDDAAPDYYRRKNDGRAHLFQGWLSGTDAQPLQ